MTDSQIEVIARKLCRNRNIDPDAQVYVGNHLTLTPAEFAARQRVNPAYPFPEVLGSHPNWRLLRRSAVEGTQ